MGVSETVFGRVLDWLLLCESFVQIVMAKMKRKIQSETKKILDYDTPGINIITRITEVFT